MSKVQTKPAPKSVNLSSTQKQTEKLSAQPGQAIQLMVDGQLYTGQKTINGRALRLVRKGDKLILQAEAQDQAQAQDQDLVEVSGFFSAEPAITPVGEAQTLDDSLLAAVDPQALFEAGGSVQLAAADLGAVPVTPAWGTLVAQAAPVAAESAAVSAATTGAVAAESIGIMPVVLGAVAIAAAAGGGGGGGAVPSTETPAVTTINGAVTLGPVIAGHGLQVQLYQADGTTALGAPVTVNANGTFTATFSGYSGVVKAKLIDANDGHDFKDESTGQNKDINADFWAVGSVTSGGTVTLNINPLTTLAFKKLGANPTAAQVDAALAAVETAFGLTAGSLKSTTPIATNDPAWAAANKNSAAAKLGMALATLSGLDALNAGDMAKTIDDLASGIGDNGTLNVGAKNQLLAGAAQADATVSGGLTATIAKTVDSGAQAAATDFTASTDVTTLSAAAVALLSNTQLEEMTAPQIGNLASGQLGALTGPKVAALGTDITGLSAAQVAALSNTQLQALSADQKTALKAAGDLSSLSAAQLQLLGIDISAPVFPDGVTKTVSVAENAATSTVVYDAQATDNGGSADAGITYTLSDTDANSFNISTAGVVTLKASADFETKASYAINVVATDAAGNASTQAVTVNVTDVDAPTFTSGTTATFAENGTGTAYDANATPDVANAVITYTLSGTDAGRFDIDETSGVVTFKTGMPPNFEAPADDGGNNVYNIVVTATEANNSVTSTQNVDITVTDVTSSITGTPEFIKNLSPSIGAYTPNHVTVTQEATQADPFGLFNTAYKITATSLNSSELRMVHLPAENSIDIGIDQGQVTLSGYFKRTDNDYLTFGSENSYVSFDFSTGQITNANQVTAQSVQNIGNGWYRIQLTFNESSDAGAGITPYVKIYSDVNFWHMGTNSGVMTEARSVLSYGLQLEKNASATGLIRTTSTGGVDIDDAAGLGGAGVWTQEEVARGLTLNGLDLTNALTGDRVELGYVNNSVFTSFQTRAFTASLTGNEAVSPVTFNDLSGVQQLATETQLQLAVQLVDSYGHGIGEHMLVGNSLTLSAVMPNFVQITSQVAELSDQGKYNIIIDGNSIYDGGVSFNGSFSNLLSKNPEIIQSSAKISEFAASSHRWADILSTASEVDSAYVPGKKNILIVSEGTNTFAWGDRDVLATWNTVEQFINQRLSINPDLEIYLISTLPAFAYGMGTNWNEGWNSAIEDFNLMAQSNLNQSGIAKFIDIRQADQAFNHHGSEAEFLSTTIPTSLWRDQYVHPNEDGLKVMADYISNQIALMRNSIKVSLTLPGDPGDSFTFDDLDVANGIAYDFRQNDQNLNQFSFYVSPDQNSLISGDNCQISIDRYAIQYQWNSTFISNDYFTAVINMSEII